ncbi:murein L,D-transpeptidase catalytic domain family protein [Parasphingorhabdus sp.]|uniref:murein L,D-transpeptidase catalytic domain family protein n=1 Tax=Parasphingorhabdus sp. TaxID=2709688 RepID=UPI002F95EA21
MNRRNFIGASLVGLTGLMARPAWAALPNSLNPRLLAKAKAAMAQHRKSLLHTDIIGIADYSLHSAKPRFHIVDLESGKVSSLLVAHGKGSDPKHTGWLKNFSNVPGSEASSGGAYLTSNTYTGKHGLSQRLKGLDPSNDLAEARAIVIHGAWYAERKMVKAHGKLGRSQGCFAFSETDLDQVLARLTPGHLIYAGKA